MLVFGAAAWNLEIKTLLRFNVKLLIFLYNNERDNLWNKLSGSLYQVKIDYSRNLRLWSLERSISSFISVNLSFWIYKEFFIHVCISKVHFSLYCSKRIWNLIHDMLHAVFHFFCLYIYSRQWSLVGDQKLITEIITKVCILFLQVHKSLSLSSLDSEDRKATFSYSFALGFSYGKLREISWTWNRCSWWDYNTNFI